ncbi:uncharacterized protein LOC116349751 [Contarinia nasturtii]|uniref:uncharacterized protein LOC116349751 n=1 Tax=Contarinia nasturtii TaxID=265458 RepID=UPI0012D3935C|nr:uncharacterized protein LOC116349751 [Contarinia nasturtii]
MGIQKESFRGYSSARQLSKRTLATIIILQLILVCQGKAIVDDDEVVQFNSSSDFDYSLDFENEPKPDEDTNIEIINKDDSKSVTILSVRSRRFSVIGTKWNKTHLTWRLVNKTLTNLDSSKVRHRFGEAFDKWAQVSRLTFEESNSTAADIQISFKRLSGGSYVKIDGPKPNETSCHPSFSENTNWVLSGEDEHSGVLFFPLALYVFGHALGLSDSSVKNSVMYSRYIKPLPQELHEDDIMAIQFLYGEPEHISPPNISIMTTSTALSTPIKITPSIDLVISSTTTLATTRALPPSTETTTTSTSSKPPTTNPKPHDTTTRSTKPSFSRIIEPISFTGRTTTTFFRRKANSDTKIVIGPDGIEFNGNKVSGGFDSIIIKRRPIESKTTLNSAQPIIFCILSTCHF